MAARVIRIGILGDFSPEYHSHRATNASLEHAAGALERDVEATWIPTPSLLDRDAERTLEAFDGLWASPGSPYRSMEGMLAGIRFARVRDWPFIAT
jgi:CTP synthase (UTP-ammonia lyase)